MMPQPPIFLGLELGEPGLAGAGDAFAIRDLSNVKGKCTIGIGGSE